MLNEIIFIEGLLLFYFLPFLISIFNRKTNHGNVLFVNLFFGWTIIGWIIALYLALSKNLNDKNLF